MAGIDANCLLCLHCDSDWTDSSASARVITAAGGAAIDTGTYKFAAGSGVFDGSGDFLTAPNHTDFNFGTGDFTLEAWIRKAAFSGYEALFARYSNYATQGVIWMGTNTGGTLEFFAGPNGASIVLASNNTISINTWTHVAVARESGVTRLFVGGAKQTATHTGSVNITDVGDDFHIASNSDEPPAEGFAGNIDEIRVSNNARYTADFVPATVPFSGLTRIYSRVCA